MATENEQVNALVDAFTMRINGLVYSTLSSTVGQLLQRPELNKRFVDADTGARGRVEVTALGSDKFQIYLRGTNEDYRPIIDAETMSARLSKNLPGTITAVSQDGLTVVVDYLGTPEQRYIDCVDLTRQIVEDLLSAQGTVALCAQREPRAISSPHISEDCRVGVSVTRAADERGFAVTVSPYRKGWSETALMTVFKWMMPNFTVVTVGDIRSETFVLTITP